MHIAIDIKISSTLYRSNSCVYVCMHIIYLPHYRVSHLQPCEPLHTSWSTVCSYLRYDLVKQLTCSCDYLFTQETFLSVSINPVLTLYADMGIPSMVLPTSAGALTFLVGIATFIAGVVMLVRAKRALHHSSQPPPPGTDHYNMVDEGVKRAPLGACGYEETGKQHTQTDEHTKHYQELDLTKMEGRDYASIKV